MGDRLSADERSGLHVEDGRQVRDIMTPTVYTVAAETPVPELARAMISGRVHRLFVTRKGRIVGIVTSLDLLELLCEGEAAPILAQQHSRKPEARAREAR
jgi:CBS-domain-containing membrane protein